MPELTYLQAISDGLREEMRADESVFCLGEDVGAFGGAFKITEGFIDEFGLSEIASGTNPFSAEAQAQMTEIFERCDVDPEALSGSLGG